ncbi:MAG: N-6 DNA methylase [Deltaproteobacteria bacterium]|nr:N-6 DNA methylase [Deltaproteobacteria bacterium]
MARRKTPRGEAQLAFEAIAIEGGLLAPEWLSRVAQLAAEHQSEPDYRTPKGLNLRDEIGRYWRIAQAHWSDFARGRVASAEPLALARQFVLALLRESFGFGSLTEVPPVELEGRVYPIGFFALGRRVPVVVAPAASGLDTLATSFGDESRRRSAFGLVQEYLNADEAALWGIVSDGVALRIARDNASLTRPAWIEADLGRIFTEERFADFAALWLLAHESRFGKADRPATECPLEVWREAGRQQGTRAREKLRHGVEQALLSLGQGFLAHPENQVVRAALQSGELTTKDYFNQLLRLVYRIIFLLTVEERGLLHPDGADQKARALYASGYSLGRLRERCVKRSAHDRFGDLWQATKIIFGGLTVGEPRLGLPALAGIFAKTQCPMLDASKLENRALLTALFRLSWIREDSGLSRVNWRDMGPEELGSVYESLLELVPQITQDGRQFSFATGGETKGNARKTSGSYYTPDSLVQVLLDSALEPVVESTLVANPDNPVEALLQLSVVDPACGSGHFLLAAARRLAAHVARLRANGTPSAPEYRHALREVIARCIYGVDLNLMAVELCKVSLWMEAVEPGLPLTFLDSHIQHGNALLGTTPELMAKGIPDAAWDAIEGDDRKVASALKKRNKKHGIEQQTAWSFVAQPVKDEPERLKAAIAELEAASDASPEALAKKESQWDGILGSAEYRHQKLVADAWCAAFVWPKQPGPLAEAAPTNEVWRQIRDGQGQPAALTVKSVAEVAEQYRFFHWHLQFPQVFAKGGFAVVLGNPPWERVKLQEQEFFAVRDTDIADAPNAAARKKLIARLAEVNPPLWNEWCAASRAAEGESHSVRQSSRYPLCGKGDVNTYALFAEHNRAVLSGCGRAGFIVPTGIATDDTTKDFFGALVEAAELASLLSFENEEFIFPTVHHAFKFALLTIDRSGRVEMSDLMFFARHVAALADRARHFALTPADFATLNPNTRTCPTFRSGRDAGISLAIYRRFGVLVREHHAERNPWHATVKTRLWHMAEDADWFRNRTELESDGWSLIGAKFRKSREELVPLLEAKMIHHFDHRFATYEGQSDAQANQGKLPELDAAAHSDPGRVALPFYWVPSAEVHERLRDLSDRGWLLGWRDICRSTDQRTLIASLFPRSAAGHTLPLLFLDAPPQLVAALYANLCSAMLDYAARQKVGGTHLTYNYLKQLPILPPATFGEVGSWSCLTPVRDWLLPRVLELTYTAWDLEPFAHDVGYDGSPFRWDPERRFLLRCELDAAFFHLYGLSRDDTDYVMDTFPIVRKNDEKAHGEYRTKRVILEIYDAMAEAARTGIPYRTRLDPPPADPRVAHPGTTRPEWARPARGAQ